MAKRSRICPGHWRFLAQSPPPTWITRSLPGPAWYCKGPCKVWAERTLDKPTLRAQRWATPGPYHTRRGHGCHAGVETQLHVARVGSTPSKPFLGQLRQPLEGLRHCEQARCVCGWCHCGLPTQSCGRMLRCVPQIMRWCTMHWQRYGASHTPDISPSRKGCPWSSGVLALLSNPLLIKLRVLDVVPRPLVGKLQNYGIWCKPCSSTAQGPTAH